MKISKLGEFGLIERIKKTIKTDKSVIKGIGDDAAVLKINDKYILMTADLLIEGVHFNMKSASPFEIGHKAIACSLSDIAAMGGVPRFAIVTIGLPKNLTVEFVDGIYDGINSLAKKFEVNIVGGDTTSASRLTVDMTLIGQVRPAQLVCRSGAREADILFVTGRLGGAVRSGRHLIFMPRIFESQKLVKNFKINAMIDISDGLSNDLTHLVTASGKGAFIYDWLIPASEDAGGFKDALDEGEDYELLFSISTKEGLRLARKARQLGLTVYPIGEVVDKRLGINIVDIKGRIKPLKAGGWRHF